ncbi:DUF1643 domain-containing protein [Spirosoma pomorum]
MTTDEIDHQEVQDSLLIPYRPAMQIPLFPSASSKLDIGADLSPCEKYRFTLWRIWDSTKPLAMIIGLNPSTANATDDDSTIRRCVGFTRTWGFGGFYMMNLFCYRATEPTDMKQAADPIGEGANAWLVDVASKCQRVVFAWGCHGTHLNRDKEIIELFPDAYCLGKTKEGHPKHPLYLAANTPLERFQP